MGDPSKDKPPKKGTKLYYILYPNAKEKERQEEEKEKESEGKDEKKEEKKDNPMKGLLAGFKKKKEEKKKEEEGEKKEKTEAELKKEAEEKKKKDAYDKKRREEFNKALNRVIRPAIQEDTKDPVYKNFLYDVLDFVLIIESHQKEVEKVKKLAKDLQTKKKDKPIKEFMCPLGEKCPDFESDRWPISNTRGTKPLGKKCPFAHHPNELYFKGQKMNKKKYLKQLEEKMDQRLEHGELTKNEKLFKHSGAVLTNMHGLMKTRNHEALVPFVPEKNPQAGEKKKEELTRAEKLKMSKKVEKK